MTSNKPEGNFPINLKLIQKYQRKDLSLMAKYNNRTYNTGSFCGGSNIDINLITCKDDIVVPPILQIYLLHWYHTYILHPGMDITEAIIFQNLYWPNTKDAVCK